MKWRFFAKLCPVLVNAHSCLKIQSILLFLFESFVFPLGFVFIQFLPILFSGLLTRRQEIKRIQAGRLKTKLRIDFENLVKLKSLR